jgi:hypothetical protein
LQALTPKRNAGKESNVINYQIPKQYDFNVGWLRELWRIRNRASMQRAFKKIQKVYEEIAEFKFEDACQFDEAQAIDELCLDLHIAKVRCRNLDWLRETFENDTLAPLSLAIAREIFPKEKWTVLENDYNAVVVNDKRTLVFDMRYFDFVSAEVSLALAGDFTYMSEKKFRDEYEEFTGHHFDFQRACIREMTALRDHELVEQTAKSKAKPDTEPKHVVLNLPASFLNRENLR